MIDALLQASVTRRVGRAVKRDVIQPVYSALAAPFYGAITHVATDEPCVALTFDDGPHPRWTPAVLEVIERHGAKGTFFFVGESAAAHRDVVEAAARAGHAIGSHTATHRSLSRLPGGEAARELADGHAALGGLAAPIFRTPFGSYGIRVAQVARRLGLQCVLWDAHACDWLCLPPGELARLLARALHPGAIVLLHDDLKSAGPEASTDRSELVGALDEVLTANRDRYRFVTVPELLSVGRPMRSMYAGWVRESRAGAAK